jgi:hypothetical protein
MCSRCDKTDLAKCSFAEFKNIPDGEWKLNKCENDVCPTCDRLSDIVSSSMNVHGENGWRLCPDHMTEIKEAFAKELVESFKNDRETEEFLVKRLKSN